MALSLVEEYEQWWLDELAVLDRMCPGLHQMRAGSRQVPACSASWARAEAAAYAEAHRAARRGVDPDFAVLDHDQVPAYQRPRWCPSCQTEILEAIAQLPDLTAALWAAGHDRTLVRRVDDGTTAEQLPPRPLPQRVTMRVPLGPDKPGPRWWREYLECKHSVTVRRDPDDPRVTVRACEQCLYTATAAGEGRVASGGSTDGSKGKGDKQVVGSPSPSPAYDSVEELMAWAGTTAARLQVRLRHSEEWGIARAPLSKTVQYLLSWSDQLLASDMAQEVGREVVSIVRRAGRAAGVDELEHRLETRCPHCKTKGLERKDGDDKVVCRRCRHTWSEPEYQWLVKTALDEARA